MTSWVHSLFWRWRARRFQRAPRLPAILLYRSISRRDHDPLQLGVDPRRFDAHLEWLARHAEVLPLADFVHRHEQGQLPASAVAITFDGGYADNFTIAEAALRRFNLPATVFITTDYINSPAEGWWDELDGILLETPSLPETFRFEEFTLRVDGRPLPARRGWTVCDAPETLREKAFLSAAAFARRLRRSHRQRFLHALRAWSGTGECARPDRLFPTWAGVRGAARRGLLAVGAHTRSHPALAALPYAEQAAEIEGSCSAIRTNLGLEPTGFSFPFGTHRDYSAATIAAVRSSEAGFACATMPAHFNRAHSRWQLPRVSVGNWETAEFAARLGA